MQLPSSWLKGSPLIVVEGHMSRMAGGRSAIINVILQRFEHIAVKSACFTTA